MSGLVLGSLFPLYEWACIGEPIAIILGVGLYCGLFPLYEWACIGEPIAII